MKHILITIAAVVLVGCSESQQSAPLAEAKPVAEAAQPKPTTPKAPDISIHKAAQVGNIEAVKQHLADGADVNAKDFAGATALHNAVRVKVGETTAANKDVAAQKEIIELLIAAGADVNARGEHYPHLTPLNYALFPDQPEIYDLLLKHGGKTGDWFEAEESIHIAARVGHVEAIKKHLADGVDVNAKDKDNIRTPLDSAIVGISHHKQTEAADLLRKHGGKTAAWLEAGESIYLAASAGHVEAIKKHLAAGADVNAKRGDGITALHYAARKGHKVIVELLIANGADVNVSGGAGITPLDYAIRYKKPEIYDLLLKHGGKRDRELKAEGK